MTIEISLGKFPSRSIAERLMVLRLANDFSQNALGKICGFSQSHVVNVENATHRITVDTIEVWARACGYRAKIVLEKVKP